MKLLNHPMLVAFLCISFLGIGIGGTYFFTGYLSKKVESGFAKGRDTVLKAILEQVKNKGEVQIGSPEGYIILTPKEFNPAKQ